MLFILRYVLHVTAVQSLTSYRLSQGGSGVYSEQSVCPPSPAGALPEGLNIAAEGDSKGTKQHAGRAILNGKLLYGKVDHLKPTVVVAVDNDHEKTESKEH